MIGTLSRRPHGRTRKTTPRYMLSHQSGGAASSRQRNRMGTSDIVVEKIGEDDLEKGNGKLDGDQEKGIERGGEEPKVVVDSFNTETTASRLETMRPAAPVQVVSHGGSAPVTAASPFQTIQTPPQATPANLNSRAYTNRISLFLFVLHLLVEAAAIGFFIFKAVEGLLDGGSVRARKERRVLRFWLPPVEGAAIVSVLLGFAWQRAVRWWPTFMVRFILWASSGSTMAAGVLLVSLSMPATDGVGVALIAFSIGTSLYACWVTRRTAFTGTVFDRALRPAAKFPDLEGPAYLMLGAAFLWISLWCFAVIGALNFYYPPLTIIALGLSLAWTAEVMRNVANLTVSRVVALYYLRGMQSSTQFSFQRAVSRNLGSACLGSLFVPSIEALRIIARGLNLLEGEDEFMFSCAHCCLHVMESVFRYGNSWAFVHIATYGKGFVAASQSTWGMFERHRMEAVVDADITSSICFLSGVSSGALCVIFAASWTFASHRQYTATVSLLAFFVGYLMTRIGMALPQACVACYYVCYAENPNSLLFDKTIPDRINLIRTGRDAVVSTPRFPWRLAAT